MAETVRRIMESFAGPDFSFTVGEICRFPLGKAPRTIELNSEPFTGAVPHDARVFDQAAWDAANKPRVEPPAPKQLREPDILVRFGWTKDQFQTAKGSCGFPARHGFVLSASTMSGRNAGADPDRVLEQSIWMELDVERWANAIKSLRVR